MTADGHERHIQFAHKNTTGFRFCPWALPKNISLTRMLLRNLLAIANLLVVNRRSFIVAAEAVFLGM